MTSRNYQQGLSFIELLIALVLGLTLMSASMQFIVSTRQTYELNDDISRVQENGRIALDIITKDLRLAGYRRPFNGDGITPDFFETQCASPPGSPPPCMSEGGTVGGIVLSDRLAVQFDPPPDDGTERSCQDQAVPATSIITKVYTIADLDNGGAGDGVNSLYCQTWDSTNKQWIDQAPVPLVDGIDNIQILYGVAGSAANTESVTKYIAANQLQPADLLVLRSVRVAILVSNGLDTGFGENKERKYRVLDSDEIAITDAQSRRIYSTTVSFNNFATL